MARRERLDIYQYFTIPAAWDRSPFLTGWRTSVVFPQDDSQRTLAVGIRVYQDRFDNRPRRLGGAAIASGQMIILTVVFGNTPSSQGSWQVR